jgi:hypothetical protein
MFIGRWSAGLGSNPVQAHTKRTIEGNIVYLGVVGKAVALHRYHLSPHSAYSIRITLLAKALPAGTALQSRSAGRSSAAAGMNSALARKASRLMMKHVVNHS